MNENLGWEGGGGFVESVEGHWGRVNTQTEKRGRDMQRELKEVFD